MARDEVINTFQVVKFIEEKDTRCDDPSDDSQNKLYFAHGSLRIDEETGEAIIRNDLCRKAFPLKGSLFERCVFTEPGVLVVTCKHSRPVCFLEEEAKMIELSMSLRASHDYRDMR
jgi:hypothetical protein